MYKPHLFPQNLSQNSGVWLIYVNISGCRDPDSSPRLKAWPLSNRLFHGSGVRPNIKRNGGNFVEAWSLGTIHHHYLWEMGVPVFLVLDDEFREHCLWHTFESFNHSVSLGVILVFSTSSRSTFPGTMRTESYSLGRYGSFPGRQING